MRVLQHHGDVAAQCIALEVADVDAVDGDRAGLDVVEPVEQVGDGRLARAGGADERDLLPRPGVQRDVLEHRLAGIVAEGDVVEHDVPLQTLGIGGVRRVRGLGVEVHDAEHALRAGQRREDRAHLLRELADRAGELAREVDEDRQAADVEPPQRAEHAADARRERIGNLAGVAHDRTHHAAEELRLLLLAAQVVVEQAELLLADVLVVEHLDDLLPGDVFLDVAVQRAERRLLGDVVLAAVLHQDAAALGEYRNEGQRDQRQPEVGVDHDRQRADQRQQAGEQRGDGRVEHGADVVHVVGEAAHDLAVGFVVVEPHRQALQLVEQVVSDLLDGVLRHGDHQPALQIGGRDAD